MYNAVGPIERARSSPLGHRLWQMAHPKCLAGESIGRLASNLNQIEHLRAPYFASSPQGIRITVGYVVFCCCMSQPVAADADRNPLNNTGPSQAELYGHACSNALRVRTLLPIAAGVTDKDLIALDTKGISVAEHLLSLQDKPEVLAVLCGILSANGKFDANTAPAISAYAVWTQAAYIDPANTTRIIAELTLKGTCELRVPTAQQDDGRRGTFYPTTISRGIASSGELTVQVFEESLLRYQTPIHHKYDVTSGSPMYVYSATFNDAVPPTLAEGAMFRPARITIFSAATLLTHITGKRVTPVTGTLAQDLAREFASATWLVPASFTVRDRPLGHGGRALQVEPLRADLAPEPVQGILLVGDGTLPLPQQLAARFSGVFMMHNVITATRERRTMLPTPGDRGGWSYLSDIAKDRYKALYDIVKGETLSKREMSRYGVPTLRAIHPYKTTFYRSDQAAQHLNATVLHDIEEHFINLAASGALGDCDHESALVSVISLKYRFRHGQNPDDNHRVAALMLDALFTYGSFPHSETIHHSLAMMDSAEATAAWMHFVATHVNLEACVALANHSGDDVPALSESASRGVIATARAKSVVVTKSDTAGDSVSNPAEWNPSAQSSSGPTGVAAWEGVQAAFATLAIAPTKVGEYAERKGEPREHTFLIPKEVAASIPAMAFYLDRDHSATSELHGTVVDGLLAVPYTRVWATYAAREMSSTRLLEETFIPKFFAHLAVDPTERSIPALPPNLRQLGNPWALTDPPAAAASINCPSWNEIARVLEKASIDDRLTQQVVETLGPMVDQLNGYQLVQVARALEQVNLAAFRPIRLAVENRLLDTVAYASLHQSSNHAFSNYCVENLSAASLAAIVRDGLTEQGEPSPQAFCAAVALASAVDRRSARNIGPDPVISILPEWPDVRSIRSQTMYDFRTFRRNSVTLNDDFLAQRLRRCLAALHSEPDLAEFISGNKRCINAFVGDSDHNIRASFGAILSQFLGFEYLRPSETKTPSRPGTFGSAYTYVMLTGLLTDHRNAQRRKAASKTDESQIA